MLCSVYKSEKRTGADAASDRHLTASIKSNWRKIRLQALQGKKLG